MNNEHSIILKLDANGVATGVNQVAKSLDDLAISENKAIDGTKRLSAEQKLAATAATAVTKEIERNANYLLKLQINTGLLTAASAEKSANQEIAIARKRDAELKKIADNNANYLTKLQANSALMATASAEKAAAAEIAIAKKKDAELRSIAAKAAAEAKAAPYGRTQTGYAVSEATVRSAYAAQIREETAAVAGMDAAARRAAESKGILAKYSHQFMRTLVDLTPIISGLGLLTLAHGAIQATDQYTKLTSQLKNATNSTDEYGTAMAEVKRISSAAQVDIGAIGSLYQRLSLALQASGTSQKSIALITETVSLGLKANGASARESASAMLQLSQSFGSGRMAGEEFNSMAEAAPNILRALATSMGVPYGALKGLAAEGKITTEVMAKAFTDPVLLEAFRTQAASMRTITGSWVELTNALVLYVGETSKASGGVGVISGAISLLANNLKLVADTLILVAGVLLTRFVGALVISAASAASVTIANISVIASLTGMSFAYEAASLAIGRATIAMKAFNLTNPIGWITLLVGAGVTAWMMWGETAEESAKKAQDALEKTNKAIDTSAWDKLSEKYQTSAYILEQKEKEKQAILAASYNKQAAMGQIYQDSELKILQYGFERQKNALSNNSDSVKKELESYYKEKTNIEVAAQQKAISEITRIQSQTAEQISVMEAKGAKKPKKEQEHQSAMLMMATELEAKIKSDNEALSNSERVSLAWTKLKDSEKTKTEGLNYVKAQSAAIALDEIVAQDALNKQLADGRKYYEDYWTGIATSTEKLIEESKQVEWETSLIGKSKDVIAAMTKERENSTLALAEENLQAMIRNTDTLPKEIELQLMLIDALQRKKAAAEGKATATAVAEDVAAQTKAYEEQWKMIDGFAHTAFDNIFDKGKNVFKELGNAIKKYLLDMLYKMTLQKWIIPVSITGGVAASGMAAASTMGGYSGGTGLMDIASSGLGMAMSGLTASQALTAASAYGSAALSATTLAEGISMATSGLSLAMPYIGMAMAAVSVIGGLFGSKGTPTSSLGNAAATFSSSGAMTGQQTYYGGSSAGVDTQIQSMQDAYMRAASGLGITAAATQFSFGANTGANGKSPNFALGGGVQGQSGFYQAETATSDAAVQLAASRAVFAALQGSELPQFLAKMFDGLVAGSMTQQDIENTLAFAGSVKQMRDALLETRAPLEIMRQQVKDGMTAFATSAETFRTDFVAAIDAGINPQTFEQWKALGTAIDQLASVDAEAAARSMESAARLAKTNLDWQQQIDVLEGTKTQRQVDLANALEGVDISTATLINKLFGLQDAAKAASDAAQSAAQAAADAAQKLANIESIRNNIASAYQSLVDNAKFTTNAIVSAQDDITNGYLSAQDKVASAQQAITDVSIQASKEMKGFADNISEFLAQMQTTDIGGGSKVDQFSTMLANFTIATAQAKSGDVTALGGITGQAQALLESRRASATSAVEYARFAGSIAGTLDEVATLADGRAGPLAEAVDPMTKALADLSEAQSDLVKWQKAVSESGASTDKTLIDYASDWRAANDANAKAQVDLLKATTLTAAIDMQQLTELQKLTDLVAQLIIAQGSQLAGNQNFGVNTELNKSLARVTGYTGDFGSGGFSAYASERGIDVASLRNLYGFADGINEVPYDMVANIHAGEEIKPKAYVDKDKSSRDETNKINSDMRAELAAIRAELVSIKKTNYQMAVIEDRREEIGMPEVREAA